MSSRSFLVGVLNQTCRPMRPGRISAGSRRSIGTLVAPMKYTCSSRGRGAGSRSDRPPTRRGTMKLASSSVFVLLVITRFMNGGLSMPSITTRSWLSAMPPMPPPIPPGNMKP